MHPDKAYTFVVFVVPESRGELNLPREPITKTEKVNPHNISKLLDEIAKALAKIGRNEGNYLIQSSYLWWNPAGTYINEKGEKKGKTIHIPQYLIDHYKEKEKN
jgi:hypothetical protein